MTTRFQRAVNKTVPKDDRREAIEQMIEAGERENLKTVALAAGQSSDLRKAAIDGLARCGGTEQLEALAGHRALEGSLRRRAADRGGPDVEFP